MLKKNLQEQVFFPHRFYLLAPRCIMINQNPVFSLFWDVLREKLFSLNYTVQLVMFFQASGSALLITIFLTKRASTMITEKYCYNPFEFTASNYHGNYGDNNCCAKNSQHCTEFREIELFRSQFESLRNTVTTRTMSPKMHQRLAEAK